MEENIIENTVRPNFHKIFFIYEYGQSHYHLMAYNLPVQFFSQGSREGTFENFLSSLRQIRIVQAL